MDNREPNMKKLEDLPFSTPSRIVIPSRGETYTFEKDTYREDYLGHCINKIDYENIIHDAGRTMGLSWSKKRLNDQIKLPKVVISLAIVSVALTIIYMILLYLAPSSTNGTAMLVVAVICVSLGSALAFGLSIYNFFRKIGKFRSLEEIIKEDLDVFCESVNEKYQGNLVFKYNSKERWLECRIKKVAERGDREERKNLMDIQEEQEKENEKEEEDSKKIPGMNPSSNKHSRTSSQANPSKLKLPPLHARIQSEMVKKSEIELGNISNDNKNK